MTNDVIEMVTLPVEDVKALLDIATNSMDFGSGFWDHEECEAARKIAVALGIDPMNVTPGSLAKEYRHPFKPREIKYAYYTDRAGVHTQSREAFMRSHPTTPIISEWEDPRQRGLIYTDGHCEKCQQTEDSSAHRTDS